MRYKVNRRDWINLIATIGIVLWFAMLTAMVVNSVGLEDTVETIEPTCKAVRINKVHITDPAVESLPIADAPNEVKASFEDLKQTIKSLQIEDSIGETDILEEPEPEPEPAVDEYELELLAIVIFQEAGSDAHCDECRRRVADVVLNRVAHDSFPNTIYDVLTQPAQYGRLAWTGIKWPDRAQYDCEAHAVERAYRIAEEVLKGNHSELYGQGYIWQAEFVQGKDNIYCCGHYFGR